MNYAINDKVIHAAHGSGQISAIKDTEIVEGFKRYYVINYPDQLMTVYIPVGKMEELGFRSVMKKSKQAKVLEALRTKAKQLSSDYKVRQAGIREMLKTNRPVQIAHALRDLTWYEQNKSLTMGDQKLLNQARHVLVSEIAAARNMTIPDVTYLIDTALQASLKLMAA